MIEQDGPVFMTWLITEQRKVVLAATVFAAAPILLLFTVLLVHLDLKRAFLQVAGFVVGGVKDDVGIFAVVSTVLLALVWLAIAVRCLLEARFDHQSADSNDGEPTGI